MSAPIRILLADDHELVRAALRTLIEKTHPSIIVVGEASDGREAVRLAIKFAPDIAIMDVTMPKLNGIEATRQIVQSAPGTRVIAVSLHDETAFVERMLQAGATGYVLKQSAASELTAAIAAVSEHRYFLSPRIVGPVVSQFLHRGSGHVAAAGSLAQTPIEESGEQKNAFELLSKREREVLQLLAEGKTSKEIGAILHIGLKTVETHRGQIMSKLEIRTIAELTKYAVRQGITSL